MTSHAPPVILTFLPGLHGTTELYDGIKKRLPRHFQSEFIDIPSSGKQDYQTLTDWLDNELSHDSHELDKTQQKRIIIAESFSGPLALRWAAKNLNIVAGVILVSSFCDTPLNPGISLLALLPLRPLFMVKPPRKALRHFLIGDDASEEEVTRLKTIVQTIPSATLTKRVRAILALMERDSPPLPNVPMMLLQAQSDNLIPWDTQQKLEFCYPNARTHWIESPHLMLQRHPQQSLNLILSFISEINPDLATPNQSAP